MISERLKNFLDKEAVPYQIVPHRRKMTAQEIAAEEHVSGWQVAKAVILKGWHDYFMAVTPACREVDLTKLSRVTGYPRIKLAEEREFQNLFPDCELGAMPPFGKLYGISCYADWEILQAPEIWFNGGNLEESVKMQTADYKWISDALFEDIAAHTPVPWAA